MKNSVQTGVTLIELMVVVAMLAIIASIALPAYTGYIEASRKGECINEARAIQLVEAEFSLSNNGTYFSGGSADQLAAASGNLYVPSRPFTAADGTANCSVSVAVGNPATSYVLTMTGKNKLPNTYTFTVRN